MKEAIHIDPVDVIIPSSYRRPTHIQQLRKASEAIASLGRSTYPPAHTQETVLSNGFVLLEGTDKPDEVKNNLWQVERSFLEGTKRSHLVLGVVANGYDGHSSSVEKAFALAHGKNVALTEPIRQFGSDVPQGIRDILLSRQDALPKLPVDHITETALHEVEVQKPTYKPLDENEKRVVFSALLHLAREHKPIKITPQAITMETEPDLARFRAQLVYEEIAGPLKRYPDEFPDEEKEQIKRIANRMARIAYLEGIGALAPNPLPDLIHTLSNFHAERREEGATDDNRFLIAADSIIEKHVELRDKARRAVIDNKGKAVDQGETLLDLFSDPSESDKPYEGVSLVTFDETEEILANRLLHELDAKTNFSYENLFGYIKKRRELGRNPAVVVEGRSDIPTKYDGVTAWIKINPENISQYEVGLSFNYRIKRILANIRVTNAGLED